jgi:hypothetical protein
MKRVAAAAAELPEGPWRAAPQPIPAEAVKGNIIADFPVINKSFNLSYSGTDRFRGP